MKINIVSIVSCIVLSADMSEFEMCIILSVILKCLRVKCGNALTVDIIFLNTIFQMYGCIWAS